MKETRPNSVAKVERLMLRAMAPGSHHFSNTLLGDRHTSGPQPLTRARPSAPSRCRATVSLILLQTTDNLEEVHKLLG